MSEAIDTVRLSCTAEGYEQNTIDLYPRWTRNDTKSLEALDNTAYIDFLRSKMAACHLETYDQAGIVTGVIDDPAGLTDEAFDDLDEVLIGWLGGALYTFIGNRRLLGNASARVLSSTNGKETPAPIPTK